MTYIGGFEDMISKIVPRYDFDKLLDVAYVATKNLNQVIYNKDENWISDK